MQSEREVGVQIYIFILGVREGSFFLSFLSNPVLKFRMDAAGNYVESWLGESLLTVGCFFSRVLDSGWREREREDIVYMCLLERDKGGLWKFQYMVQHTFAKSRQ